MGRTIKIIRVADGATKFYRLERVSFVKSNIVSDGFRVFSHEPSMERKVACIQSTARVHKTTKRGASGGSA